MSLQDDLARNRRIFEILTGENREQDEARQPVKNVINTDSAMQIAGRSGFSAPESASVAARAGAGFGPPGGEAAGAVFQTARARGFSLKHGTVDLPAGFSELPGIGSVTYPEIRQENAYSAPERIDLMEPMYSRTEAEARMSSQLSREEGFFGF